MPMELSSDYLAVYYALDHYPFVREFSWNWWTTLGGLEPTARENRQTCVILLTWNEFWELMSFSLDVMTHNFFVSFPFPHLQRLSWEIKNLIFCQTIGTGITWDVQRSVIEDRWVTIHRSLNFPWKIAGLMEDLFRHYQIIAGLIKGLSDPFIQ